MEMSDFIDYLTVSIWPERAFGSAPTTRTVSAESERLKHVGSGIASMLLVRPYLVIVRKLAAIRLIANSEL